MLTATNFVDWTRPWYASLSAAAGCVTHHADWRAALNDRSAILSLRNHRGLPLHFVDQSALPQGVAYETFISTSGCVPCRDNLHDFFNALVWLSFPRIKRQLNALQATQIASQGIGQSRGPARDAATIFDENAALWVARDNAPGKVLVEAVRNHQWRCAFMAQRSHFGEHAEVWLFGHALMEKLVTPYKRITAHAWVVTAPNEFFSMPHETRRTWLDEQVANQLTACNSNELSTACFTPLPVLGIPGWWPQQDREFYDDRSVFRPKPSVRS